MVLPLHKTSFDALRISIVHTQTCDISNHLSVAHKLSPAVVSRTQTANHWIKVKLIICCAFSIEKWHEIRNQLSCQLEFR